MNEPEILFENVQEKPQQGEPKREEIIRGKIAYYPYKGCDHPAYEYFFSKRCGRDMVAKLKSQNHLSNLIAEDFLNKILGSKLPEELELLGDNRKLSKLLNQEPTTFQNTGQSKN